MDLFTDKANSIIKELKPLQEKVIYDSTKENEEDAEAPTASFTSNASTTSQIPTNSSEMAFTQNLASTNPKNTALLKQLQAKTSQLLQTMNNKVQAQAKQINKLQ